MYVSQISIFGNVRFPLALGFIYGLMAERYELPSLETLQASLKKEVTWPSSGNRLQVYYCDSLMEDSPKDIFQVRFAGTKEMRELISIFLSVESSQIKNITFNFPGRAGRGAGSAVIAALKSTLNKFQISQRDLQFEIQCYPETGYADYWHEYMLSSFVWVEPLDRYLHVKEDPRKIQSVRHGKTQL